MTETDLFTGRFTIWNYRNATSQPGISISISSRLRPKPALPFPMQMNQAVAFSSTPLPHAQPSMQVAANNNMNIPPTARASKRPLLHETIRSYVDLVPFSFSSICAFFSGSFFKGFSNYIMLSGTWSRRTEGRQVLTRFWEQFWALVVVWKRGRQTDTRVL